MDTPFIKVIVPLKLDWEPCYRLEEGESAQIGDRVMVPFAGRPYMGVVCSVMAALPAGVNESSVKPIYTVHRELAPIKPSEMAYWRTLAEYYMCSVGEVFKAAYPVLKEAAPKARGSRKEELGEVNLSPLSEEGRALSDKVSECLSSRKTVMLDAPDSFDTLAFLASDSLSKGENVLWLVPEMTKEYAERVRQVFASFLIVWNSDLTPARRRDALARLRDESRAHLVLGTRGAVLLPFEKLSLVLVQDEDSQSYKQSVTAPRFNGRDAAALLALQKGARLVLESPSPSMESLYNCMSGKYISVSDVGDLPRIDIIDTAAEARKKGMNGDISRKLLAFADENTFFYKPARAAFPKIDELRPQLVAAFGEDVRSGESLEALPDGCTSVCVFGLDALLGRKSFRSDERAFNELLRVMRTKGVVKVAIQTRESSHPVLLALQNGGLSRFMEERRSFAYPPYTRIVDILVRDTDPVRASGCISALNERITSSLKGVKTMPFPEGLRLVLPKDRNLSSTKSALRKLVNEFGTVNRCLQHISFDVDPN